MGQIDLWGNEGEDEVTLTYEQKIEQAKDALQLAARISRDYYHAPLIVTYSGGKDSEVMLDIALDCLEPDEMEVLNAHTTVDAPETVRHIEKVFRELNEVGIKTGYHNRYPVEKTMWELIVEKKIPISRFYRYCCSVLKEASTPNRICAVGVREDESVKRKGREIFTKKGGGWQGWKLNHAREVFDEAEEYDEVYDCVMVTLAKKNEDLICNPIYKFTEQDIWRYIHDNELEVNPLYRMGYRRVGCIGCPLGGRKQMQKEFSHYPKYKQAYIMAFDRMLKARIASGKSDLDGREGYHRWETGQDVFNWWINSAQSEIYGQTSLFEDVM